MAFSLTRSERDPYVGRTFPGVDYGSMAMTAWLDSQIIAHDLNACREQLRALSVRIANGRQWLERHQTKHAQFRQADRLFKRLTWELDEHLRKFRSLQINGWAACCSTYAALQHLTPLEREAWWQQHGNDQGTWNQPLNIWRAAGFTTAPPSGWPPDREGWEWEGYSGWGLMPRHNEWLEEMQ